MAGVRSFREKVRLMRVPFTREGGAARAANADTRPRFERPDAGVFRSAATMICYSQHNLS